VTGPWKATRESGNGEPPVQVPRHWHGWNLNDRESQIYLITKIRNVLRACTQLWGTAAIKRRLWDREYDGGRWDHCEDTHDDFVYDHIQKHCKRGSILDLGCGSGNTGNELARDSYRDYTGVDISDVAIRKAQTRSERNGRGGQNRYLCSDISAYVPSQKHDIILFRESIYYIASGRIPATLERYASYLSERGVFIVRLNDCHGYEDIAGLIESRHSILEKHVANGRVVIVFR
jgi:SAM-dependent methyltransferase